MSDQAYEKYAELREKAKQLQEMRSAKRQEQLERLKSLAKKSASNVVRSVRPQPQKLRPQLKPSKPAQPYSIFGAKPKPTAQKLAFQKYKAKLIADQRNAKIKKKKKVSKIGSFVQQDPFNFLPSNNSGLDFNPFL